MLVNKLLRLTFNPAIEGGEFKNSNKARIVPWGILGRHLSSAFLPDARMNGRRENLESSVTFIAPHPLKPHFFA
jgi:hypothetical protein